MAWSQLELACIERSLRPCRHGITTQAGVPLCRYRQTTAEPARVDGGCPHGASFLE